MGWGGPALIILGKKCKASQERELLDPGTWAMEREGGRKTPVFLLAPLLTVCGLEQVTPPL